MENFKHLLAYVRRKALTVDQKIDLADELIQASEQQIAEGNFEDAAIATGIAGLLMKELRLEVA